MKGLKRIKPEVEKKIRKIRSFLLGFVLFLGFTFPLYGILTEKEKQEIFAVLPNTDSLKIITNSTKTENVIITTRKLSFTPEQIKIDCKNCDSLQRYDAKRYSGGAVYGLICGLAFPVKVPNPRFKLAGEWSIAVSAGYRCYASAMYHYNKQDTGLAIALIKKSMEYFEIAEKFYLEETSFQKERRCRKILEKFEQVKQALSKLIEYLRD